MELHPMDHGAEAEAELTMKQVIIDGQVISVPEGNVTGAYLRRMAKVPDERVIYQITPEGDRVIHDDTIVDVQDGERFGTMGRVIAA